MSTLFILFGFAAAAVIGWLTLGQARAEEPQPGAPSAGISLFGRKPAQESAAFAPPATNAPLARADLEKRLQRLSDSPAPAGLSMGAMCYDVAAPPNRIDYTCPVCSNKTLYALTEDDTAFAERSMKDHAVIEAIRQEIPACRRLAPSLAALEARLDESQFCRTCSPAIKAPKLVLILTLAGDPQPRRVEGVDTDDMILLREFLEGQTVHQTFNEGTVPLKNAAARLAELLGLPAPIKKTTF